MICKKCGQENSDEFTFCQNCGKRLDGKKICPACGAKIDEDAKFCGVCGANLESANSEIAIAQAVAVKQPAQAEQPKTLNKENYKKVVDLIGTILVCFAAFMGLLFTFIIGVSAFNVKDVMIYHYFGEAYEAYNGIVFDEIDFKQVFISLMSDVTGTLVSAASILGTLIFGIRTALEAYKKFARKKESTKLAKYATGTYIWFAVSATLFLAMHAMSTKAYSSGVSLEVAVRFNGATLAGLILGGIALGGYYCCKIINNLKQYKNLKVLTASITALVVAVLAVIVTSLAAYPVLTEVTSGSPGVKSSAGYFVLANALYRYNLDDGKCIEIVVSCLLGYASQVIISIMAVIALIKSANAVCGGKEKKLITYTVVSLVFSVINLLCAILLGIITKDLNGSGFTLTYGAPIAILVFSVLALAGSIVYAVLSSKNKAEKVQPEVVS